MEIDDERLTIDELKAISKQLPTVEEVCFVLSNLTTVLNGHFR